MPYCQICYIYYTFNSCPNCTKNGARNVNAIKIKKFDFKGIWLASNSDELDFIWAQICEKTLQRVQLNNIMLRQGFFNVNINNESQIQFEFIGSTFNQGFLDRLEKLYPGIENIFIICDIVRQSFSFPPLKELLDDILLVNRNLISKIYLIWLEPYINVHGQYNDFKTDTKTTLREYLNTKSKSISIEEIELSMYSTQRFSSKIKKLFEDISGIQDLSDYLQIPLRPLFRTQQPILDQNIGNRVVILDLESSSLPSPVTKIKEGSVINSTENIKCLACYKITKEDLKCLTCNNIFCSTCISVLNINSDENFCLGSIYFGLHRLSILK